MINLDLSRDSMVFDGQEPLTIHFVGSPPNSNWLDMATVQGALRRKLSRKEMADSGGHYTSEDTIFLVPKRCVSRKIEVGSLVEADCGRELWSVDAIDTIVLATQFRLTCKRGFTSEQLTTTFTVQEAANEVDSMGAPYDSWKLIKSGVKGVVQEMQSGLRLDYNQVRRAFDVRVYLEVDSGVEAGMRVVASTGEVYNISRVSGKGVIGGLLVADGEAARLPSPAP